MDWPKSEERAFHELALKSDAKKTVAIVEPALSDEEVK